MFKIDDYKKNFLAKVIDLIRILNTIIPKYCILDAT